MLRLVISTRSSPSLNPVKTRVPLWASLLLVTLLYGGAGLLKVASEAQMIARLHEIGFGASWRYFIGVTELLGVLALALPRLRRIALLLLWPYGVGGLAIHIAHGHGFDPSAVLASLVVPLALYLDGGLVFTRAGKFSG